MVNEIVSQEKIEQKIFIIRGQKVMFDKELAVLYQITTGNLNKAVSRNLARFPEDFMFQLTKNEIQNLMFQNGISSWGGTRKLPRVFTEHGILMLSSVLNSERAIQVNIQIMRTFTKLRKMLLTYKDLRQQIEKMEKKYDYQFEVVFDAIKKLLESPQKPAKKIGFIREKRSKYKKDKDIIADVLIEKYL
ncbi:MAG: ORF6N domain-containing protein [bacterium]|nr:ORF6N domain-containing protein [bacterium]